MKKFLIILYLGFVTLGCIFENTSNKKLPPKVENGILDLRDWNFAKDGIVSLDGEWEFYPNEFLRTVPLWDTDRIKIDAEKNFIQVPSKWESFKKNGESIDKFHFASYRIKILLPNADNYLSIHLPSIGASYSFFVNGVLIANAGNPARIKEEYIPAYNQGVFDFQYDQEDIEIIVQAASFDYQNGSGLWEPLLLGLSSNINVIARKNAIIDAMTIGTLLIMALYHFSFFFIRRKEASAFFFGLFCFCMAIRVSVFGGRIITDFLYIFHNYFLIVKAEILSLYLLLPSFINFTPFSS